MTVICIDNSFTWRNSLTVTREYEVLRSFQYSEPMIEIKCDDGAIRRYRASRFKDKIPLKGES